MTENTIITASGRTREEITASVRIHMRSMVNNALEIGMDLVEMKEACQHGEWLPWLKEIGLSASTAANYMRIAREVNGDSKMAQLPYTKILALMAAPKEDREALAEAAGDMSAAEIRKLTEERNRAAAAANAETERANQAEADAKRFYDDNARLRTDIQTLGEIIDQKEEEMQHLLSECDKEAREEEREKIQAEMEALRGKLQESERMADQRLEDLKQAREMTGEMIKSHNDEIGDLKARLLTAENNRVEVEKIPEDYERLKRNQAELLEAAASAEDRANAAEAELERFRLDGDGGKQPEKPVGILLNDAVNTFLCSCDMMTFDPVGLQRDAFAVRHGLENLQEWIDRMQAALATPVISEANVI